MKPFIDFVDVDVVIFSLFSLSSSLAFVFVAVVVVFLCAKLAQLERSLTANQGVPGSIAGLVEG